MVGLPPAPKWKLACSLQPSLWRGASWFTGLALARILLAG